MIENINDIDDIKLILRYKRAEATNRIPLPDIEEERRRFWKNNAHPAMDVPGEATEMIIDAIPSDSKPTEHSRTMKWKRWCIATSAAAAIFLGISFALFFYNPTPDRMQVYTADASASDSKLNLDDDTFIIKGEKPDRDLYAHGIIATEKYIDLSKKGKYSNRTTDHKLTLTTPCGKDYAVTLSDGTKVLLNAGSQLIFPESFGPGNREVYLKGEAMFDVTHDPKHPFIVKTDYFQTRVLGTKFNLRSYSKEDTHVTLIEGKVTVTKDKAPEITLNPNEQAALTQEGVIKKQTVDTYQYLEWQNGFFYFDNVSLTEIMQELGRWYNVDVVFRNEKMLNYRMHFVASRDESLMEAIKNLNALGIFYVTLDGKRIVIQ